MISRNCPAIVTTCICNILVTVDIGLADPRSGLTGTLAQVQSVRDGPSAAAQRKSESRFHQAAKALADGAVVSDWADFLGSSHNGISPESPLVTRWGAGGPTLVWEMRVGSGFAAPAVKGDRLVFCHRVSNEIVVDCVHAATGGRVWQFAYATDYRDRYGFNNGPRSSPVIEGDRVVVLGPEGMLHCVDLNSGRALWKRDLMSEYRLKQNFFGFGTTPLVDDGLIIINVGAPGGPCVVGLDLKDGSEKWRSGERWGQSYASPVPGRVNGQRRVFVFSGGESEPPTGGLLVIDPASGQLDGRFPFRSRTYESVNAASPVVVGGEVFLTTSYDTGGVLLRVPIQQPITELWRSDHLGSHWATPVHRDGYLYGFSGSSENDSDLVCLEWRTGKLMWTVSPTWEETVVVNGKEKSVEFGIGRGSLVWADGQFFCLGERGHLLRLELTPQGYHEVQRTTLFLASETWTGPVLSHGLLYVCQNTRSMDGQTPPRLLCYDLRPSKE